MEEVATDVPPVMWEELTVLLRGATIKNISLFRGLSEQVVGALCGASESLRVLKVSVMMPSLVPSHSLSTAY